MTCSPYPINWLKIAKREQSQQTSSLWADEFVEKAGKKLSGLKRQLNEITSGGLQVALRKIRAVPIWILAFCFFVFIRLIKRIILVRFDFIIPSRIGHLLITPAIYLGHRQIGTNMPSRRYLDLFYLQRADAGFDHNWAANDFILKKIRKRMHFLPRLLLSRVAVINGKFGNTEHSIITKWLPCDIRDLDDVFCNTNPPLWFTTKEEARGLEISSKMGLKEEKPFVCIYNRDNSYLAKVSPISNWDFYQYRNFPASDLLVVASTLIERGFDVVRMGSHVESKIKHLDPRIIEYCDSEFQSSFMDVFLSNRCTAFFGSDSGLTVIPEIFKKTVGICNTLPLSLLTTNYSKAIVLPKILCEKATGRLLSIRESFEFEQENSLDESIFASSEISYKFNSHEQLIDLVDETIARSQNTWVTTEDDEILQQRIWSHFDVDQIAARYNMTYHKTFRSTFSTLFLRKNKDWYLDPI